MGTIFVAYGEPEDRNAVLEFAAEQAAPCGHDLHVYHTQESADESPREIREEIDAAMERTAPAVTYEVEIETEEEYSDQTNVSEQKRLTDALLRDDRDYEYAVMGDVERGSIEEFTHGSMTKAVLKTHAIPVLLVPI